MKTYKLHLTFCILIALASLSSCKKQIIGDQSLTGENSKNLVSNVVEHANFTTPDSVAGIQETKWGKISYDLNANRVNGDSVLLSFDGNLCREIHAANGYTLKYVDLPGSSISSISGTQILAANLNAVDSATAAGKPNDARQTWFTFSDGKQYGIIPVKDRYLVLFKGDSIVKTTALYVLQLNAIEYVPGQMSGYYFGGVKFDYKRLI
ncbi:hypothetical protein [Pedobacter sp. CFBP9032]|uniref:hypothetical protein n=1 Tax=Pedobacter sp. CFBP9032 TaxID=3096539 RepID=UPI002A698B2B|nr:hypothetical protein [Pedobacter sp. CFBP9032]MDY0906313.1 hypothetical protein [Pedobacter sp. CFBP9032]